MVVVIEWLIIVSLPFAFTECFYIYIYIYAGRNDAKIVRAKPSTAKLT